MNCKNCGAELKDGIAFCPSCGAKIESAFAQENTSTNDSKIDYSQRVFSPGTSTGNKTGTKDTLGLVASIVAIVFGVGMLFYGFSFNAMTFGADFYTYTYEGIQKIFQAICFSTGGILLSGGLMALDHYLKKGNK